jgi:serine/threonine protein kinase
VEGVAFLHERNVTHRDLKVRRALERGSLTH